MHKQLISAIALAFLSACSNASAPAAPAGESDLMCAALIHTAAILHDDETIEFYSGMSDEVLAPQIAFLTRHAEAEGLDSQSAMGIMKFQRVKLMKSTPPDEIRTRALACLGR